MEEHQVLIGEEQLFHFVGELFQYAGMPREDALMHARALVDTDLWGISSHGVMRVPAYFTRMLNGAIRVRPQIHKAAGDGALEVLDGDAGAGGVGGGSP